MVTNALPIEQKPAYRSCSRDHLRLVYSRNAEETKEHVAAAQKGRSHTVIAIIALALVVGMLATILGSLRQNALADIMATTNTEIIHVMPGDTLWSIAASHAIDNVSTYDEVQWIMLKNGLQNAEVRVGSALEVPCASSNVEP